MPSKRRSASQRAVTRGKIIKLQRAGLLSRNIDPGKRPSKFTLSKIYKYREVISGKKAAVRVSSAAKARELRGKVGEGGQGRIVIVPRQRGEKFTVSAKDEIKSTRNIYGQTVKKTIGDKFTPPRPGEKVYYTIPTRVRGAGGLKRRTFASFDELLFYLEKYEINFEDMEDYIEVERFSDGSRRQKQFAKEYRAGRARAERKRLRSKKRGKR